MSVKERIPYLDAIKGLAMLMVVVYHTHLFPENYVAPVLSMCVPLFFCVNGYLTLRKQKEYRFILRKAIRILLLVLFWSIVDVVSISYCRGDMVSFNTLKSYVLFPEEPYNVYLWFLYSIIGLLILSPVLRAATTIEKKTQLWILGILVLFSFQGATRYINPYADYLNVLTAFPIVYFIAGFLIISDELTLPGVKNWHVWCIITGCFLLQYGHNYLANQPAFRELFIQGSQVFAGYNTVFTLFATIGTVYLFKQLKNAPPHMLWVGQNSLGIYLIHYPIMRYLQCVSMFDESNILLTIAVILLSVVLVAVLKSNKYTRIIISL